MLTAQLNNNKKGFTLIELLVVIGILAVLLAIVLIAINPARQFGQANDTKRRSDVQAILNAVGAYAADNHGTLPSKIPDSTTGAEVIGNGAGEADICDDIVTTYISSLPVDPNTNNGTAVEKASCTAGGGTYTTGYSIVKDATTNVVTVSATGYSGAISVSR